MFIAMAQTHAPETVANEIWPVDFYIAYKTSRIHKDSAKPSFCRTPIHTENTTYNAQLFARPFGISRDPAGWRSVVTITHDMATRFFDLDVGAYLDDVSALE